MHETSMQHVYKNNTLPHASPPLWWRRRTKPTSLRRPSKHRIIMPSPVILLPLTLHHRLLLPPPQVLIPLKTLLLLSHRHLTLHLRLPPQIQASILHQGPTTKMRRLKRLWPLLMKTLLTLLFLLPLLLGEVVLILLVPAFSHVLLPPSHFLTIALLRSHVLLFLSELLIATHGTMVWYWERTAHGTAYRAVMGVMGVVLCLAGWRLRVRRHLLPTIRIRLQRSSFLL